MCIRDSDKGQIHIDDTEKANILNRQFSSVFTRPDGLNPPLVGHRCTSMPDIVVNLAGVRKLLKDLNPNKASGPDGISSKFLKELGNEIAPGLTLVMQASIHQSATPKDWCHALVAPVFKPGKGDKSKAENYRPISVRKLLKDLNPNKASGPDGISSKFLRELGNEIAPGLTLVMQASIINQQLQKTGVMH